MEKVAIRAYAVKHKLSLYNVIKMVKTGKLESIVVNEGEKEVTYVIPNEKAEKELKPISLNSDNINDVDLKKELLKLAEEVRFLKKEIETLKNRL